MSAKSLRTTTLVRSAAAVALVLVMANATPIRSDSTTEPFLAGEVDDFAPPPDPTSPSQSLIDAIPDSKPLIDFDQEAVNERVAHTFPGLPACATCAGANTLEFRMRATAALATTDGLFLQRSDGNGVRSDDHWRITLSDLAGCTWGTAGCDEGTYSLDLCDLPDTGASPNNVDQVVSQIATRRELEVDFQDDTMVDYLLLNLTLESTCDDQLGPSYWYRQCRGVPASEGGIDRGRGKGPGGPTEPGFQEQLMPCADARLEALGFAGLTTCQGIDADPPGDVCERAERQLTTLILNSCSTRQSDCCPVDALTQGCSATTVGDLVEEVAELIHAGACRQAARCAAAANQRGGGG